MGKKIPVESWTRVVGYYRPDKDYNPGKLEEVNDRTQMSLKKIKENLNGKGRQEGKAARC